MEDLYDAGATPSQPSSVTTSYSFDTSYGRLLSTSVADGTDTLTRQLGYGFQAGPDPVLETLIGGGSIAGTYQTTRTFQHGRVLTERRTSPTDLGWDQFHVGRDSSTDAITSSSDPNGISTTYAWDALGRLTGIAPTGEAATEICYLAWSASAPTLGARVLVKRGQPAGCSTSVPAPTLGSGTAEAYVYDGFGRLIREIRLRPTSNSGSYLAVRVTKRNDAGLVWSSSEWTPCGSGSNLSTCFSSGSTSVTTFEGFDVLGRPTLIHPPDRTPAPAADERRVEKKYDDAETGTPYAVRLSDFREDTIFHGTSSGTTWQAVRKDLFGRVIAATEPANAAPFGPDSWASWNVLDKLVRYTGTRTVAGQNVTQTRTWIYNRFGFLTSETSPEAGSTTYGSFNALGNPQSKVISGDGTATITQTSVFDALGRLRKTYEGAAALPDKLLLANEYDESTDSAGNSLGFSKGKLTTARSWNRYPSSTETNPWNGYYAGGSITDALTYSGPGGRLTKKRVFLSNGTVSAIAGWTYNNLGLVENEVHPRIDPNYLPGLTVTTGYTAGMPTSVSAGGQVVASSVTYDPAGGLAGYTAGNNYRTTIAPDDHGMSRPKCIKTDDTDPDTGPVFNTGDFAYDGAGNILSIGSDGFTYDAASRLLSATYGTTQSYSYDGWGNLTSKAGVSIGVDRATNRLQAATYDFRGNVEALGADSYRYDSLGRLVRHDNEEFPTHLSYLFDAANERIVKAAPPPPLGPGAGVLRREMARIIVQAMGRTPMDAYLDSFSDVPRNDPERGWIERLLDLGVTRGCYPSTMFCPDGTTTRREMAAFLSRALLAPAAVPSSGEVPSVGTYNCEDGAAGKSLFTDVPPGDWGCANIHYLYSRGITLGCGPGTFCPDLTTTHAEMVRFVSRAWSGFFYVPPGATYSFRGPNGSVLTEFQDGLTLRSGGYVSKDFVYLGNRLVGTKDASAGWMFHVTDHLGSVRLTMSGSGNSSRKYWPWGEETEWGSAFTLGFAGMERDAETEYDRPRYYDHARSIETGYGRFLSPDVLPGMVEDPLSWNRYAYARNNPLKYVDPDGRATQKAGEVLMAAGVKLVDSGVRDRAPVVGAFKVLLGAAVTYVGDLLTMGTRTGTALETGRDLEPAVMGDLNRAMTIASLAGPGLKALAGENVTLFRAVTAGELKGVVETGKFAAGENTLGGKFFAESAGDAAKWGAKMNGEGNSTILKVTVPKSDADQFMRWNRLDGIGPARYAEIDQLGGAKIEVLK